MKKTSLFSKLWMPLRSPYFLFVFALGSVFSVCLLFRPHAAEAKNPYTNVSYPYILCPSGKGVNSGDISAGRFDPNNPPAGTFVIQGSRFDRFEIRYADGSRGNPGFQVAAGQNVSFVLYARDRCTDTFGPYGGGIATSACSYRTPCPDSIWVTVTPGTLRTQSEDGLGINDRGDFRGVVPGAGRFFVNVTSCLADDATGCWGSTGGGDERDVQLWADVTVIGSSCTCTWDATSACGASGSCGAGQKLFTRTCEQSWCNTNPPQTECRNDSSCGGGGSCDSVGPWVDGACGASPCSLNERFQSRNVSPTSCDSNIRCVADPACGSSGSIGLTINPPMRTIMPGESTSYTVDFVPRFGFSANVTIQAQCPGSSTCTFADSGTAQTQVLAGMGTATKVLNVTNTSGLALNTYEVRVTASGGGSDASDSSNLQVYAPCAAPQNLQPTGSIVAAGNQVDLTWQAVPGATSYRVRLNDDTDGSYNSDPAKRYDAPFPGTCGVHYLCEDNVTGNRIDNVPVVPGHTYHYWIHAVVNSSVCSPGETNFTPGSNPPGSNGVIQGFKVKMPSRDAGIVPPRNEIVTLDGNRSTTENLYRFSSVAAGNHTVFVSVPNGWSVGYTLCTGPSETWAACHDQEPTLGNVASFNLASGATVDLWWHYYGPRDPDNPGGGDDPVPLTCPLSPRAGRILADFRATTASEYYIVSHRNLADAQQGPVTANIPAGTYQVTLVSYDTHFSSSHVDQPSEQFYLRLLNAAGTQVGQTASIADLPGDREWLTQVVNSSLTINQAVGSVIARHSAYPLDPPNYNSIYPVCAAFDQLPPPDPPPVVHAAKSACERITVSWTDVAGETEYRVYRDDDSDPNNGAPGDPTPAVLIHTAAPGDTSYTYPITNTGLFYYFVSSYSPAGGESQRIMAAEGQIAADPCEADLGTSDKDIIGRNGQNWATGNGDCDRYTGAPASQNITYRDGDIIKFEINLCNSQGEAAAAIQSVLDTLSNMGKPATGWNARYQDAANASQWHAINPAEGSNGGNITLTFSFPSGYTIPPRGVRKLTFEAKLILAEDKDFGRFYNTALITYRLRPSDPATATELVSTPPLLFFGEGSDPNRFEIPPN